MESPALTISKEQRVDMVLKGLSPLNPEHVEKYIQGYRLDNKDKMERIQKIFKATSNNLGGGLEVTPSVGEEFNEAVYQKPKQTDIRSQLNEDLANYVSGPTNNNFNTNDFVSIKKENPTAISESLKQLGFTQAKDYLNLFVISLQNSDMNNSFNNRLKLFKALKLCLETENKLKNNTIKMKLYREGVVQAEKAMLNKLQG